MAIAKVKCTLSTSQPIVSTLIDPRITLRSDACRGSAGHPRAGASPTGGYRASDPLMSPMEASRPPCKRVAYAISL